MTIKKLFAFFLFGFSFFPISAMAQCRDSLCQNLQNILYASVTDFRAYRENLTPPPNLSAEGTTIPCHTTEWTNDVAMYLCAAEVPASFAQIWYETTLSSLGVLRPAWYFRIDSPATGHVVDGGPPGCEVSPTDGPYLGNCPFHLEVAKKNDGTAKIYLWVNSLSSPYLAAAPPASQSNSEVPIVGNACDKMCEGLKQALETHLHAFSVIRASGGNSSDGPANVAGKLPGASECLVQPATNPHSSELGTQYVCYWPETSASDADARFRDLVSRLQVLVPANWSTRQEDQMDKLSGAKLGAWVASAPGDRQEIAVYASDDSVGFHIKAWTSSLTAQIPR